MTLFKPPAYSLTLTAKVEQDKTQNPVKAKMARFFRQKTKRTSRKLIQVNLKFEKFEREFETRILKFLLGYITHPYPGYPLDRRASKQEHVCVAPRPNKTKGRGSTPHGNLSRSMGQSPKWPH